MAAHWGVLRMVGVSVAMAGWGVAVVAGRPTETGGRPAENAHVWAPKPTSVAVFKNGYGFFVREGDVQLRDGWCAAETIPPAVFGTLAIYAQEADRRVDLVGAGSGEVVAFDGRDVADDLPTRRARLNALRDLKVELAYVHREGERTVSGQVTAVEQDFVVLDTGEMTVAVEIGDITRLKTLELPLRVHVQGDDGEPSASSRLGMAYLRSGITWIPEYTLRIIDAETAELTLRGTLVNEAEDLVHAEVNFVVGVPAFLHTDYLAPIAVGQVIRTLGGAMGPSAVQGQLINRAAIVSNSIRADQFNGVGGGGTPAAGDVQALMNALPQLHAASASDYSVYTQSDLTVRRGERAIVTLFTRRVAFSHLYRWNVPEPIRHLLRVRNDTDAPWTTGPCLAISGAQPLSEDLLAYTPAGGMAEIPVTAAINIAQERTDEVVSRELKVHNPHRDVYFDLVTLKGTLKIRNFEKRPVELVVNMPVRGTPQTVSPDGDIRTNTGELRLLELTGQASWRVELAPGETQELTCVYTRYVTSQ